MNPSPMVSVDMPFSLNADIPLKLQVFFGATAVFVFIISTITAQAIAKLFEKDIDSEIKGEFPRISGWTIA